MVMGHLRDFFNVRDPLVWAIGSISRVEFAVGEGILPWHASFASIRYPDAILRRRCRQFRDYCGKWWIERHWHWRSFWNRGRDWRL